MKTVLLIIGGVLITALGLIFKQAPSGNPMRIIGYVLLIIGPIMAVGQFLSKRSDNDQNKQE